MGRSISVRPMTVIVNNVVIPGGTIVISGRSCLCQKVRDGILMGNQNARADPAQGGRLVYLGLRTVRDEKQASRLCHSWNSEWSM